MLTNPKRGTPLCGPSPSRYGFSRARYVYSLISAVGIFFLGAGVSVYHGVSTLMTAHTLQSLPLVRCVFVFGWVCVCVCACVCVQACMCVLTMSYCKSFLWKYNNVYDFTCRRTFFYYILHNWLQFPLNLKRTNLLDKQTKLSTKGDYCCLSYAHTMRTHSIHMDVCDCSHSVISVEG